MPIKTCLTVLTLLAAVALPARGGLLISEVLYNEVGSNTTGEWIEIFNTGSTAIDLSNYKIGDEETSGGSGTGEAMHQFPAGSSIGPYEVQIVSVSATQFLTVYGFAPTYEVNSTDASVPDMLPYPSWDPDGVAFNMANGTDHALILGPADELVDAASWDSTFAFNPGLNSNEVDGQSYERINALVDTNTAADWQLGPGLEVPAEDRSTPGTVEIPEPATLVMVLCCGLAASLPRRGRSMD